MHGSPATAMTTAMTTATPTATPTIFIVDDDADVCRALARLLRSAAYETRTFGSAREFLAAHDPDLPGCIILDLAMPELNGLEVQAALAASGRVRPIVFLTGNGCIAASVTAMKAGAVNFLTKPVENRELFVAVDEALQIDAAQRRMLWLRNSARERLGALTPRERQVLEHVVSGRLNKQIAADLGTVEKTIKVHRARVMHKMGVRSLAELVRLASFAGVICELATQEDWVGDYAPADQNDRPMVMARPKSLFSRPAGGSLL